MDKYLLIINPWVYDFAAFDLWAKPLGLLYLSAWLKKIGFKIRLVDCLDRLHPLSEAPPHRPSWKPGTGKWARKVLPAPESLQRLPRHFARYGWPEAVFRREITLSGRPDLVLVTSNMTYWYPGVQRAIALVRETWPEVPVVLGGVYATLCRDHAEKHSGADVVVAGPGEDHLPAVLTERLEVSVPEKDRMRWSDYWPDLDLYPHPDFAPLLTSRGCLFRCPYCASHLLFPGFVQRDAADVLAEIEDRYYRSGLKDFTFFDDALLIGAEHHLMPLLEGVLRRGLKVGFHAPNGLHVGLITPELARLMFKAGVKTLRLGLESLDPERQASLGGKVRQGYFERAVAYLTAAGFQPGDIGVYILYGLPGQPLDEVAVTVQRVKGLGVRPYLAEYSPLPGTTLWGEACRESPYDLPAEPLFHNNTFLACRRPDYSWEKVREIKQTA